MFESERIFNTIFISAILATVLWQMHVLGRHIKALECIENTYRSIDGSCNNLEHPTWGIAGSKYLRLLPPKYGNGITTFAVSKTNRTLPNPRLLSFSIFPDAELLDKKHTLVFMQFGQFLAHDMSYNHGAKEKCCTPDFKFLESDKTSSRCAPIPVPKDDPEFSSIGKVCLPFTRSWTDINAGENRGDKPAEQFTEVTPYLDLDIIYGNNPVISSFLRHHRGGLLKTEHRLGQHWPLRASNATKLCSLSHPKDSCYYPSDRRINQNPELSLLHILFHREHNRLAVSLQQINPHWDDQRLFQEARKINIAQYQHVVFYEWLPTLYGPNNEDLYKHKVLFRSKGFVDLYNKDMKPGAYQEYSTAAFKSMHTLVVGSLQLMKESRKPYKSITLSDYFTRPGILETEEHNFDDFARGLCTQSNAASDRYIIKELKPYGFDLQTTVIQRGRDHGLPSYNTAREWAGLNRAEHFKDFLDVLPQHEVDLLQKFYEHPDDVDLILGASLEKLYGKSMVGFTYYKIIMTQFYRTRHSDRYWFERHGQFTLEQLNEIKKSTVARWVCDNAKRVMLMQKLGFVQPSVKNPILPCSKLPIINLHAWKE